MTQINPFAGSVLQTPDVQRQQANQASAKAQQTRALRDNVAARDGDTFEHQVENASEVNAIDEQGGEGKPKQPHGKRKKQEKQEQGEAGELDITG